ncbi:Xaa-Pro aminopeptidase [Hamadaea flava]|nr:Xaa-Pro peptidase family protein [Hamadaea flava]MCP2323664.1 Xaa-Pro aminopeptidase [Hamadaea flava]
MEQILRAQAAAANRGIDALLISPGADLRYLTGYDALPLERLTCLVIPVGAEPFLVVPELEEPAARAGIALAPDVELVVWKETADPFDVICRRLPSGLARIAVDDHMWADRVLTFARLLADVRLIAAGPVMTELRMRKTSREVDALRAAGAAIDSVHRQMGLWLRAGRTEREVARDVADAIASAGHTRADFVIIGSGPNSASPHHEASDRVISAGEPIVVDISGTMPDGYRSDCTRTYSIGEPPADHAAYFAVLHAAQTAQVNAVRPGITAGDLDAVGCDIISAAGYGPNFVHRTGHGIGLDVHEPPYIMAGSDLVIEPGMAFSIEPGIYLPGRHGARIEDIVICTTTGGLPVNAVTHDLQIL